MKTLQELIEARTQNSARMNELIELRSKENRRFTEDENTEFQNLDSEVATLDEDISIKRYEERQAAAATRIKGENREEAQASRGGISYVKKTDPDDTFKGQSYTRCLIARAIAYIGMREGNFVNPADIAQKRWGRTHPNLVNVIKAGVAGGGTGEAKLGQRLECVGRQDLPFAGERVGFRCGYGRNEPDRDGVHGIRGVGGADNELLVRLHIVLERVIGGECK